MIKITSKTNDKIKQAVKLCTDSSERKRTGLFFLEGLRLCCDAALSGLIPESLFITQSAMDKYASELDIMLDNSDNIYIVTDEIAEKLSDTKNPQGVFCVCKTLDKSLNIDKIDYNGMYVAMENIQTPGNLGAAARTAEALGLDGIIVSGGCDIYNPKALRASMGSLIRLNVFDTSDLSSLLKRCEMNGMKTYAAVPDSEALPVTHIDKSGGIICVIGNEGNGISENTVSACCDRITIPMKGRAESLNAAAAASVIMWEMVR